VSVLYALIAAVAEVFVSLSRKLPASMVLPIPLLGMPHYKLVASVTLDIEDPTVLSRSAPLDLMFFLVMVMLRVEIAQAVVSVITLLVFANVSLVTTDIDANTRPSWVKSKVHCISY